MAEGTLYEQIKIAAALTISDAEQLAVMRLQDAINERMGPDAAANPGRAVIDTIERAVSYGVDQVEHQADEATKGASKEDMLVQKVFPTVQAILRSKMKGLFASTAERALEPVVEECIRAMARALVRARNQLFEHRWADTILKGAKWVLLKLEVLMGVDLDGSGQIGPEEPAGDPSQDPGQGHLF